MMTYTILSIGPIYDTLQIADNTRAIWSVSYMFSFLMKKTIEALKDKHKHNFLVPNIDKDFEAYLESGQKIGIFHDRLILKDDVAKDVNDAFTTAVNQLADIVVAVFEKTRKENYTHVQINFEETEVREFIEGYFQSYIAAVETEDGKNPILELSKYVDAVEYEPKLAPYEEKEYLFLFLRLANLGLLKLEAFGEDASDTTKDRCFKSLPEISAWELIKKNADEWKQKYLCLKIEEMTNLKDPQSEAEEILQKVKEEYPEEFKPYHNYVAIVHGDGDAFGKYLEHIGANEEKIRAFSNDIFTFITKARDIIQNYGGYPIIGSGEDLLFFAPVIYEDKNIFTLISEIDCLFKSIFQDPLLSMSYGVSVTYYKFPLQEAMELSSSALWGKAKQTKWVATTDKTKVLKEKNAVTITIQKHSGQTHTLTLPKDTLLYIKFLKLLKQELNKDEDLHLPHSLHHSLSKIATLINSCDVQNIEPIFENFFNEKIHKTKHKKALIAIEGILKELKRKSKQPIWQKKGEESAFDVVFSILSVIKLLRGDR